MGTTLLRYLLTRLDDGHGRVLEALRQGEIKAADPASDPTLLVDMLAAVGYRPVRSSQAAQHALAVYLEQLGFDPWQKDSKGFDAFDHALLAGNLELVRHLCGHTRRPTGLADRHAIEGRRSPLLGLQDPGMVQALLEIGFDGHVVDHAGNTLLHLARKPELVEVLLKAGLDPSCTNHAGQTVRQHWDASNMLLSERQSLDVALRHHLPLDAVAVVRGFAHHLPKIGMTRSRERLAEAGVDPASAHDNGLFLPELVVAQALRQQLCMSTGYSRMVGNPVEHRKWRRALLSTLKLCGHDPARAQWASPPSPALVDALELFLALDRQLEKRVTTAPPKTRLGQRPKPKPVDETRKQLDAMVNAGGRGSVALPERLRARLSVIQVMTGAGHLDNGSLLVSYLLLANFTTSSVQNDALLMSDLLAYAQRGRWDETWQGPDASLPYTHPLDGFTLPAPAARSVLGCQGGPVLVLGLLSTTDPSCRLTHLLREHLRVHPEALVASDPAVQGNLNRLLSPHSKNAQSRALAEELSMEVATAPPPKTGQRAPRL